MNNYDTPSQNFHIKQNPARSSREFMQSPGYMLDANICIYAIKNRPPGVLAALRAHEPAGIGISNISAAELFFGAKKSGSAKNLRALQHFLEPLEIADFDVFAAQTYGDLRRALEAGGAPIGPLDTQIAAHALTLGVCLVSNNTREFARVPGLMLENRVDLERTRRSLIDVERQAISLILFLNRHTRKGARASKNAKKNVYFARLEFADLAAPRGMRLARANCAVWPFHISDLQRARRTVDKCANSSRAKYKYWKT